MSAVMMCEGLCVLLEVGLAALGVRLHGGSTRLPARGAHLTVLVCVLEGLYQTQGLIHRAAYWQVIDGDLAQVTFVINDEQASVGRATQNIELYFYNCSIYYYQGADMLLDPDSLIILYL